MHFKRDSIVWTILIVSAVLTYLGAHFELLAVAFEVGPRTQAGIELLAGLVGVLAALMKASPINSITEEGARKYEAQKEANERTHRPDPPSGLLLVLALGGALTLTGCANVLHKGVQVQHSLTEHLLALDAKGDRLSGCVTPTPPQQPVLCQTFNRVMVPVLEAEMAFNRAVKDQNVTALGELIVRIGDAIKTIRSVFTGAIRDELVADFERALAVAFAEGRQQ